MSPQLQGKLRKEILEDAEQVFAEMDEVRTWGVNFDRIQKARSLPVEKDLKYGNSLERSIFRNLGALNTLQENRATQKDTDDNLLELPAGQNGQMGLILNSNVSIA